MPTSPLLLVDGTNLAWRSACGFPRRVRSRSGVDITAVFGFFALLRKAHREQTPDAEILVCFDSETPAESRFDEYDRYKQRFRDEPEFTPFAWLETIADGLDLLSIQHTEARTYEADDDLATLTARFPRRSKTIMSMDYDFLQLLDARTRLLAMRGMLAAGEVLTRYGVHPAQWCDYRALTGDASDNIPGVRGIGPKRAAQVLHRGRRLETARVPNTWWGRRLRDSHHDALRWRDLIRLRTDQDVRIHPTGRRTRELPRAAEICELLRLWA